MLFKVWLEEEFGGSADRIGIVEADTLTHAAAQLASYVEKDLYGGDFTVVEGPEVSFGSERSYALVRYLLRDHSDDNDATNPWVTGQDVYKLTPLEGPVFTFLAEDWNLVFR